MTIHSRIEIANADDHKKQIAEASGGLVTLDSCPLADKTTLLNEIGRRLGCPTLDLGRYLNGNRGQFINALRVCDFERDVDSALSQSAVAPGAGICVRQVLAAIGRTAALSVYSAIAPTGQIRGANASDERAFWDAYCTPWLARKSS